MKIKTVEAEYDRVIELPRPTHKKPERPTLFWRTLMRAASVPDLLATHFTYTGTLPPDLNRKPCLILMNHSSFIDLEIASRILYPRPYAIVCTTDGFVGKEGLMRSLGCIPTQKFVSDLTLIRDMKYALTELNISVLMYPEASYSFDGTATHLPESLAGLVKLLDVQVLMIRTQGAFTRDPLYNCLQKRKVRVSAHVSALIDRTQIRELSREEIGKRLDDAFALDYFSWQEEHNVTVAEPFRADGLERILYTCPSCGAEGHMEGKGTDLTCHACGKSWHMDELGRLAAKGGETEYAHIPDWYRWERSLVRHELEAGTYCLDVPVDIGMMVDYKAIYMVGSGRLTHTANGFTLDSCSGRLHYTQKPMASYSLYADYYWYELGDIICIGDRNALYYCFPPAGTPVAKARLAAEEMFFMKKQKLRPGH